jgi:hypothetical protein
MSLGDRWFAFCNPYDLFHLGYEAGRDAATDEIASNFVEELLEELTPDEADS